MADSASTDLMMLFVDENGQFVWGESNLDIDSGDKGSSGMMKEFKPAPDATSYANFFEIDQFDFNMALTSADAAGSGPQPAGGAQPAQGQQGAQTPNQQPVPGSSVRPSPSSQWAQWLNAPLDDIKKNKVPPYQIRTVTGSFSRMMDSASPTFFQYCVNQSLFQKAVLIKRVMQGDQSSGGGGGGGGMGGSGLRLGASGGFGANLGASVGTNLGANVGGNLSGGLGGNLSAGLGGGVGGLGGSAGIRANAGLGLNVGGGGGFGSGGGVGGAVSRKPVAFLRVEFTGVTITSIDWSDGDVVKENCSFSAKGVEIKYLPQKNDGTVDTSLGPLMAKWPGKNDTVTADVNKGRRGN